MVVKTALVEAHLIQDYQPILAQTVGIVFLGTPHNGSSMATVGEIGARIAGVMLPDAIMPKNRSLIKSLRKDSARLFETAGRFANICGAMKIFSMYESMPTVGGVKLTKSTSTLFGTSWFEMCSRIGFMNGIAHNVHAHTIIDPPDIPPAHAHPHFNHRAPAASPYSQNSFSDFGSDARVSQASLFSAASSYASTAQSGGPSSPNSVYSTATSNYSTGVPPPRPPAKEPISNPWQPHSGQDDRRYTPSPYNPPRGPPTYPSNTRSDAPNPPPTYHSNVRNAGNRPEPSSISMLSANSSSSLYNQPYTAYNNTSNNVAKTTNTTSNSYTHTPTPNYESSHTVSRPTGSSPTNAAKQSQTGYESSTKPPPTQNARYESSSNPSSSTSPNNLSTESATRSAPTYIDAETEEKLPSPPFPHWVCDGCMNPIYPFESRIHCLDCPDYDSCGRCHELGRINKTHKRHHKEELIIKARQITQESSELVIPSDVHPERSPGRQFVNWQLQNERRIHHLSCHDDHTRYLISSLEPGNYRVSFQFELFLAKEFTDGHAKQLGTQPLGKLRVAVGSINSKKIFFKETFPEDKDLVGRLFDNGWYDDFDVKAVNTNSYVHLKCIFPVEGHKDRDDIGIFFQWSDFKKFPNSDKAVISFSLISARFEDLMEFDETFGGATNKAKPIVKYVEPPSQAPAPDAAVSMLSLDDIFKAIVEVAQEERDRQEREAFQQAIAEELARRRRAQVEAQEREAAAQLMANYMVATQATVEFALLAEPSSRVGRAVTIEKGISRGRSVLRIPSTGIISYPRMIGRGPLFLLFFAVLLLVSFSLLYNAHFTIHQPHLPSNNTGLVPAIMAAPTVVHIVLLKFADGTPSDSLKPICDDFIKLKDKCIHPETGKPYIISVKGGLDNSPEKLQNGLTHGFVLEFSSVWDRDYYVEQDPEHRKFKHTLKASGLANVVVVDFTDGLY
ncbi:hypothetical protein Dda_4377 [Drechslerella dactyloides]|uniref:Stress-response A/B barrel domain-containing protein n=1 Tax=Drechslerella dactyloides TaxID=74499 RepID=A0AAD6NJ23_DREDA|nr:hypothetical protein Dda_4377 [Drechslerella dactyloides]